MIKTLKNRRVLIILILFVIALIMAGFTFAVSHDTTGPLKNEFVKGEVFTEIEENPEIVKSVIRKDPKVVNKGPNDCIVRMRVTVSPKEIKEFLNQKDSNGKYQHINYSEEWEYDDKDGFWYYKKILPYDGTDTSSTPLFTEIKDLLNEDGTIIDEFKKYGDFQISLYQESVQTTVYDENGDVIQSAFDEDGNFSLSNAKKVFDIYETQDAQK